MPDVYVTCDVCKGKRYNRETLEVLFKGKSIADVLDMTVEEALGFFKAVPRVRSVLELLHRVGLDYIHVGQQATTLSGGEAQRVKLAKELSKRATGRTFYILDEPTTGLHFHDVAKLLEVLHELVEQGNTVVVIEHNLEVIKTADWIIDLGPEGGDGGGEIVAAGTPEDIAKAKRSYTGQFLAPVLARREAKGKARTEAAECIAVFNIRGSGRFDFAADGTFTSASPSSTISSATVQVQVSRARWRSGMSSATVTVTSTWSPIAHRRTKIERLRDVDGAGSRKPRAQHRRDQARGVEAMGDPLAELGLGGEMLRQMDGIAIAGELRKSHHIR